MEEADTRAVKIGKREQTDEVMIQECMPPSDGDDMENTPTEKDRIFKPEKLNEQVEKKMVELYGEKSPINEEQRRYLVDHFFEDFLSLIYDPLDDENNLFVTTQIRPWIISIKTQMNINFDHLRHQTVQPVQSDLRKRPIKHMCYGCKKSENCRFQTVVSGDTYHLGSSCARILTPAIELQKRLDELNSEQAKAWDLGELISKFTQILESVNKMSTNFRG